MLKYSFVLCFITTLSVTSTALTEEPFRPEAGKFPPLEKAKAYQGQLMFVDHANRRGSIRVTGGELFHSTAPHPFAMLPYGIVRYHGAPADLRDVPLGTMLHGRFYLPPDPKLSSVPVITTASLKPKNILTHPAENHAILLEDEPSFCLREGKVWKLKEVALKGNKQGMIIANREPKAGGEGKEGEQQMSIDAATRFWRGREKLGLEDLIAEGLWPADGKKPLDGQVVYLGITWKPDGHWERRVGNRLRISDIWLDETAIQRATQHQIEVHRELIRSRWMPAWVDAVEYGKFGNATVTATLFGGMDPSLYADFSKESEVLMNGAENTLRHAGGHYGPAHMASKGPIRDVIKTPGEVPLGSSGIQIIFETDLIIEGIRPGRVVRVRPAAWPELQVPWDECLRDGSHEVRFPTPAIFPKY